MCSGLPNTRLGCANHGIIVKAVLIVDLAALAPDLDRLY